MSIEVTREVKEVTVVVSREGKQVVIKPILNKTSIGDFDGIVNGGTL